MNELGLFIHYEFPESKWTLPLGFVGDRFYYVDAGWERQDGDEARMKDAIDPSSSLFDPLSYCPTRLWSTPTTHHFPSTADSTLISTYRHEPISSFHRAALSPCQKYFFTLGKNYAGGLKTYQSTGETQAPGPWYDYDLCLLRISVADGSMSKFICRGTETGEGKQVTMK